MALVIEQFTASANREEVLDKAILDYSKGEINRKELTELTGLDWFGDVLIELSKRNLTLPRVDYRVNYSEKQLALFNEIFEPEQIQEVRM